MGPVEAFLTIGMVRPRYEYRKIRQLFLFFEIVMQIAMKPHKPGCTRVEVRGEVRG